MRPRLSRPASTPTPAAIAITFLSAPATSQPATSGFVYTRNRFWWKIACRWSATTGSGVAMTDAELAEWGPAVAGWLGTLPLDPPLARLVS